MACTWFRQYESFGKSQRTYSLPVSFAIPTSPRESWPSSDAREKVLRLNVAVCEGICSKDTLTHVEE